MPTTPEFRYLEGDTAAASVSARLVANPYEPNEIHELGSSIRIAKNLYVTAKHVIEDYLQTFGHKNGTANFSFWAVHVEPGPQYSIWEVDRCWLSPCADLAVFHTRAYNDIATQQHLPTCVGMSIAPPHVGERVVAFGYERRKPKVVIDSDGTRHIELEGKPSASVGEVIEVHEHSRDTVNLNYPCFRVNCKMPGGMSGGPIFNDSGRLCGIVCYGMNQLEGTFNDHLSYGMSLWPLMGIVMNIGDNGEIIDNAYPLLDLARRSIIHAEGWQRVTLHSIAGSTFPAVSFSRI